MPHHASIAPAPTAPLPYDGSGASRASVAVARRRRVAVLAVGVALSLGLAACSSPSDTPTSTVTQGADIQPDKSAAPTPVVPSAWPLTGVAADDVATRPALAVKVENTSAARPQSGLEQADVVWETIVEFQVSRFVAVYHSQVPDVVGPIRSVRPMDPLILAPMHGLLAYSGGQAGILALVQKSGIQSISHDAGAPGLYRVKERRAPHNVYGDTSTLWAQADADHQASPGKQFGFARTAAAASAVAGGTPATALTFNLSTASHPTWTWDAGSGTWLRSERSAAAVAASGARLSAVNVVSITAAHPNSGFRAQGGAPVPTYTLVGNGEGFVATGGKTIPVTWSKAADDAPLLLFTADGKPATLAPGNTWVELVPAETGSATIS